jgi:hypothetical protein
MSGASSEARTVISSILADCDEAEIKPVVHPDGKTVSFQRAPPPDDSTWLDEVAPVLDEENSEDEPIEEPVQAKGPVRSPVIRTFSISGLPIDILGNPDLILPGSCEVEQVDEERAFVQKTDEIPIPLSEIPRDRKLKPKLKVPPAPPKAIAQRKKQKEEPLAPTNLRKKSDRNFRFGIAFLTLSALFLVAVIFVKVSVSRNATTVSKLSRIEDGYIEQLNNCLKRTQSVRIDAETDPEFIEFIKSGRSEFLELRGGSLFLKKRRRGIICTIIDFGDLHPDWFGLMIFWGLVFGAYVFVVVQKARARNLLPVVFGILEGSKDRMCFVDDVRNQMEANGVEIGWAWRFIVGLMEQNRDVKTVKMEYSKPFWTLKSG